jgi:hypothetical protein
LRRGTGCAPPYYRRPPYPCAGVSAIRRVGKESEKYLVEIVLSGRGPGTLSLTQVRTWVGGHVRRLGVVLSAVLVAVFMMSSVALSAEVKSDDSQYEP